MNAGVYRKHLENDENITSEKAIKSRISRLNSTEAKWGIDVDDAVRDDNLTQNAFIVIKTVKYQDKIITVMR